jgi:putative transposase
MTRGQRSAQQHGWFHLTDRGVDRQDIFVDDRERRVFVAELAEAAGRFCVEIHAYSLMTTHFHAVVNCPEGGLSSFMQRVLQRFAVGHNRRMKREGYVFTGRFRSDPIDLADRDATATFQQVCRYVHRNPLDCVSLPNLRTFAWSSYPVYCGSATRPDWLSTDVLLGSHGDDTHRLIEFTETPHPADKTPAVGRSIDPYAPSEVVAAVAKIGGTDRSAVTDPAARRGDGLRELAAHLCWRLRTASCDELAVVFGVGSGQALRNLANRGKNRCAIDPRLEMLADRIVCQLWASQRVATAPDRS